MSKDKGDGGDLPRGLIGRTGTPVGGKGARLPSIRAPRDLTLGGVQKKKFAPNIPVRKGKPKESTPTQPEPSPSTSKQTTREDRPGRGRGRGQGRGRGEVVQSHSIFEQGPTERTNQPRGGSVYSSEPRVGGGGDAAGLGPKRSSIKKEDQDTKRILDELLRDDFVDHEFAAEDKHLVPVQLPLAASVKMEVKPEIKVKSEPMEVDVDDTDSARQDVSKQLPGSTSLKKESTQQLTCAQLFSQTQKTEKGDLLFFHLPDTLPGVPPTPVSEDVQTIKTEHGTVKKESKENETNLESAMKKCSLADFSEGYIGKLQVLKSGKTRLVLGNVTLDVNMGTPCGFLQDLVSVKLKDGKSGDMTVLGHIQHRIVCTPDFENLLKEDDDS